MELWKEISREEVFKKFGRGIEKRVYHLPHGKEADFYIKTEPQSICCVALTKDKQIILVKQFRPGPAKILLELPGGGLQKDESLEQAMERELLEETGYRGKARFVTKLFQDAYSTRIKNALVVTECEKIAEPQLEDNGEAVEVELMTLEDFRKHLQSGELTDAEIGYLGLDYLGLL